MFRRFVISLPTSAYTDSYIRIYSYLSIRNRLVILLFIPISLTPSAYTDSYIRIYSYLSIRNRFVILLFIPIFLTPAAYTDSYIRTRFVFIYSYLSIRNDLIFYDLKFNPSVFSHSFFSIVAFDRNRATKTFKIQFILNAFFN